MDTGADTARRRPRNTKGLSLVALLSLGIAAGIFMMQRETSFRPLVHPAGCSRGNFFVQGEASVGDRSWVSVPLPVALAKGVSVASFEVVATGVAGDDVVIKLADHKRWETETGSKLRLDFRGGSYRSIPEHIRPFLEDPIGVRLRPLPGTPGAAPGTNYDNVAMFVGVSRASEEVVRVDHVAVTFRSGARTQLCRVPVRFSLGPQRQGG